MFRFIAVLAIVISIGVLSQASEEWENYKAKYGKKYSNPVEDTRRRTLFEQSRKRVQQHFQSGKSQSFKVGLNEFSDWTPSELQSLVGLIPASPEQVEASSTSPEARNFIQSLLAKAPSKIPDAVDWRLKGSVSPVKNQYRCGSCWAFSTTGCLEGQQKSLGLNLTALSEQNLIDCSMENHGCAGGIMHLAMSFIREQGGINDQKSYPYEAKQKKCRFNSKNVVMTDIGAAILSPYDEKLLKIVVAIYGPVSVAIAADESFREYESGIYDNPDNTEELNHGVLVVGYGTDERKGDYWIVKNSWGADWGENGYVRMARNKDNQNGIASQATIAIL